MKLDRCIVFFDLETTGTNIAQDRILQIGAIKIYPDGKEEEKNVLINPTIPIPIEASAVHGVYDKDVQDKPVFRQIAKSFLKWLEGCDLAGYNSDNFDIPLLIQEFDRAGLTFPSETINVVDVLKIERKVCSHKLEETYKRYTGDTMENAHDALADIRATYAILKKQLEKHPELPQDIAGIDQYCQGEQTRVDLAGKLYEKEGEIYWNFGKHKHQKVKDSLSYAQWVLQGDFPVETKKQLQNLIEE